MAGGKTFKRDQKRRKEMARKLKQEEKLKKKLEKKEDGSKPTLDDMIDYEYDPRKEFEEDT